MDANQPTNDAHLSLRTVTALEVASVVTSVLITVWLIVPLQPFNRWLVPLPALLALALMIYSHWLRAESLSDLGFTTRHFGRALLLLTIPMLLGMLGFGTDSTAAAVAASARTIAVTGAMLVVGSHIVFADLRGWDWLDGWAVWRRAATIALALAAVLFSPGFNPAFIYFQF